MKKENINNYYTGEDLINFEKLKNFKDSEVNKLCNNQNKIHPVRYALSDNKHFNKIMNINNDKSSLLKKTEKIKNNNLKIFITYIFSMLSISIFLIMFLRLGQPMPVKGPCSEYYLESVYR